jgi:hypothetical protein
MGLIEDIKAIAKDGADLSGIEGQIAGLNPLTGLTDKAAAWELIKGTPLLLSAHDARTVDSVKTGVDSFKEKGMVELWKEKELAIRAEVNPKETDDQKEIRELKERLNESDKKGALTTLQDKLQLKAKELGFDPIRAKDFAIYGEDDAMSRLEAYATAETEAVNTRLSTELKDKYNLQTPDTNQQTPGKSVKRADYDAMSPSQQREIALDKGTAIID